MLRMTHPNHQREHVANDHFQAFFYLDAYLLEMQTGTKTVLYAASSHTNCKVFVKS